MGAALFSTGDLLQCRTHLEQAVALYDPHKRRVPTFQDPGIGSLDLLAITLWELGYPDQALNKVQECLTLAEALSHPFNLADALCYGAELSALRGEIEAAQEQAAKSARLSHDQGFRLQEAKALMRLGWALAKQAGRMKGFPRYVRASRGLRLPVANCGMQDSRSYWPTLAERQ
jgi:tetratricopeptide (TPR) repeat protein